MKKTLLISLVALFTAGLISCGKSKECSCTEVLKMEGWDDEDFGDFPGMGGTSTYPLTIESGECSDLNATGEIMNGEFKMKQTLTCVEK